MRNSYPLEKILFFEKYHIIFSQVENFSDISQNFLRLNHYTSRYVINNNKPPTVVNYHTDQGLQTLTTDANGKPIGPRADSEWLYVVPWGFSTS